MSPETLLWVKSVHIFGILMWIGTLFAVYQIFFSISKADTAGRGALVEMGRSIAVVMDVGATITIIAGVVMIYGIGTSIVMKQPWMHVKLTLVIVGLLGPHVLARISLKKLRNGGDKTPPIWLFPAMQLVLVGVIIMAVVKPLK